MIRQTNYALSYNVRDAAIDILNFVNVYNNWEQTDRFVAWFNKVIEARGRVMLVDICNKIGKEPIDAFNRIGFNSPLSGNNIYVHEKRNGTTFYRLIFPVLKDFTQRGMRN